MTRRHSKEKFVPFTGVSVQLTPIEHKFAQLMAKKRAKKAGSKKFSSSTEMDIHFWGLLGEFAFWKATGIPPDLDARPFGDDGWDFVWHDQTIDIKTRNIDTYKDPDLLVRTSHATSDLYFLAEYSPTYKHWVRFVGYADREDLIKETTDLGHGERYIVKRIDLKDPFPIIHGAWFEYYEATRG